MEKLTFGNPFQHSSVVPARPTGQIQALLVTTTHLCEVVGAFRVGGTGHKGKGEGTCPPDGCAVTGRDLPVVLFRSFAAG